MVTFHQKPKLGDVILTLPCVKIAAEIAGKCNYYLDAQPHGKAIELYWTESFNQLVPILEQQEYIATASTNREQNYDFTFAHYVLKTAEGKCLTRAMRDAIEGWGWPHQPGAVIHADVRERIIALYPQEESDVTPWLVIQHNRKTTTFPIFFYAKAYRPEWEFLKHIPKDQIINASFYKGTGIGGTGGLPTYMPNPSNPLVDIGTIVLQDSLLDTFEYVAASKIYVGDASFPISLAMGFNKGRLLKIGRRDTLLGVNERIIDLNQEANLNFIKQYWS